MRVALVCGTYAPQHDGVADYVRRLALELPAAGVEPVIAAAGDVRSPAEEAIPAVVGVTPRWSARQLRRTARALDDLRCDLVHVQFAPSAYGYSPAVGGLPSVLKTPLVTTLHEYGWWSSAPWVPDWAWRALERTGRLDRESGLLAPRSRSVIATNPGHAAVLRARLGREPDLVPIGPNVPGPVRSADDAAHRVRDALGLHPGVTLLVFFGFVHPVKGVRELVDAVALLRDRGRRVHAVLAGGFASLALPGPEAASFRTELERRVADRGVSAAVTLTGWLPAAEVSELLSAADAVVLPFTAGVTTKSGSLLAALAHGTPVLTTAADHPDPELRDGVTVFEIAERRSGPAIAGAVERVLADPVVAAAVAERGTAVAAVRSWPTLAAAHAAIYRRVLGR